MNSSQAKNGPSEHGKFDLGNKCEKITICRKSCVEYTENSIQVEMQLTSSFVSDNVMYILVYKSQQKLVKCFISTHILSINAVITFYWLYSKTVLMDWTIHSKSKIVCILRKWNINIYVMHSNTSLSTRKMCILVINIGFTNV